MARTKHVQQVFWNNDRKMPKAATVPSLEDMWIALEEDRNAKKASQREKTRGSSQGAQLEVYTLPSLLDAIQQR